MSRDNAPINNTCPVIDNIIGLMESARNEADYIKANPEEDSTEESGIILDELFDAIKGMEDIRDANSELREWGNAEYERADNAESERDDAIREKEYLQEEIEGLKAEIEELNSVELS
jgi:hypothetical protein